MPPLHCPLKLENRQTAWREQRGTTLIEALIAVVVLSVGLLGLAGLQANGLKFNQGSMQRSQATLLAYSILDHMRADSAAAKAGTYDLALDGTPTGDTLTGWRSEITHFLGSTAKGSVCRVAAPNATECSNANGDQFFRITLQWNESTITDKGGNELAGGTQTMALTGRL